MSVKEIEAAITRLPAKEVAELMSWLAEYHAHLWDQQIEEDLEAGRLDALLAEVDKEYQAGQAQPL
jgi:BioD-like phosphotransacetylase family protein